MLCEGPHESFSRDCRKLYSTHLQMSNTLRVIQHNVAKQGLIQESLMNDSEIENATVLAIQEPQARTIRRRLLATPMGHSK